MPYINEETRNQLMSIEKNGRGYQMDEVVDALIMHIRTHPIDDREGMCNYAISRIVAGSMKPETGWRYKYLNRAYGTFLSAASEFYRRLVVNYENECIDLNGDIPEYKQK